MSTEKTILKVVPGVMAIGLVGNTLKNTKFNSNKPMSTKKMFKTGANVIIGSALIGGTASVINSLD